MTDDVFPERTLKGVVMLFQLRSISVSLYSSLALIGIVACSSQPPPAASEDIATTSAALTAPSFAVQFPAGVTAGGVALDANGVLNVDLLSSVQGSSAGTFAGISNAGTLGGSGLAAGANVGSIVSKGAVSLAPGATVHGNVVSGGLVFALPGATVTGTTTPLTTTLTPLASVSWTAPTPGASAGDKIAWPGTGLSLSPGTYGNLTVLPGATVNLSRGVYFLTTLNVTALANVTYSGPTVVYVSAGVSYQGIMTDTVGDASLLVAVSGTRPITIGGSFIGTLVAPTAPITIQGPKQVGAFFAHDIEVSPSTTIVHQAFPLPPSPCIGAPDGTACTSGGSGQSVCESGTCANVSCGDAVNASGETLTVSVTDNFGGGPVSLYQTTTAPTGSSPAVTTTVTTLAGQTLETETVTGPNAAGVASSTVTYGLAFHGIHEVDATTDGTTVHEVVDGRALQPILASILANVNPKNPPTVTFVDGNPAPVVTVDDGVLQAIAKIRGAANKGAGICPGAALPQISVLASPVPPAFEPGHTTNVDDLSSCTDCLGHCKHAMVACVYAAGLAGGGVGAALSAIPVLGAILGVATDIVGDYLCYNQAQSCDDSCGNVGSACCPQSCGNGCCAKSESCLSTGASLCCSAGYSNCPGPNESCVDPTKAVCLPSGAGCLLNTPTCGSGAQTVCCPSGICQGNTCVPPTTFGIVVNSKEAQGGGPFICSSGTGFTPGATARFTATGIPGVTGTIPLGRALVQPDGTVAFSDSQYYQLGAVGTCTQAEGFGGVTITATDGNPTVLGTGVPTSASLPASLWCSNFVNGGGTGNGCP